jgi:hypothetical protein
MLIDKVATNALMMVRMRVKMEKACEARNREDIRERNAKQRILGGERELQAGHFR